MKKIWGCKIGLVNESVDEHLLPWGSDNIMRRAVERTFLDLTKIYNDFCFSGWGESLTEQELAVIENRSPRLDKTLEDLLTELTVYRNHVSCVNIDGYEKIIKDLTEIILIEKLLRNEHNNIH